MTLLGKPMLFCPPYPPLTLGARDTVVVGRSRSCDLRLGGTDASRRHAEITGGSKGFVVFDLGSTNGTYVNGKRVQEHSLQPGDKIEIGSSTITFCQVGGGFEEMDLEQDSEQTIMVERPAAGQIFEGDLAEIPPFAVLQILEMGRKTGKLRCDSDKGVGDIWLSEGSPIHAETKSHSGFDAAIEIVTTTSGRFSFMSAEAPETRTIEASVTELLLEASRAEDEGLL
jgi:pSer/pThr/pTyr-binding forkhead associated (FHA) protein